MYKEYNIWDDNLDLDEWVPDGITAALVYRIATSTGSKNVHISAYKDTDGKEFDRLSIEELNDIAAKEREQE